MDFHGISDLLNIMFLQHADWFNSVCFCQASESDRPWPNQVFTHLLFLRPREYACVLRVLSGSMSLRRSSKVRSLWDNARGVANFTSPGVLKKIGPGIFGLLLKPIHPGRCIVIGLFPAHHFENRRERYRSENLPPRSLEVSSAAWTGPGRFRWKHVVEYSWLCWANESRGLSACLGFRSNRQLNNCFLISSLGPQSQHQIAENKWRVLFLFQM